MLTLTRFVPRIPLATSGSVNVNRANGKLPAIDRDSTLASLKKAFQCSTGIFVGPRARRVDRMVRAAGDLRGVRGSRAPGADRGAPGGADDRGERSSAADQRVHAGLQRDARLSDDEAYPAAARLTPPARRRRFSRASPSAWPPRRHRPSLSPPPGATGRPAGAWARGGSSGCPRCCTGGRPRRSASRAG